MTPLEIIVRSMRWTINVFFLALLLGLVLIVFAHSWLGVDLLSVASGSMEPTIPVGSVVFEKSVDITTIQPGDIIMYKSHDVPGSVVTHRVVEVTVLDGDRAFRTKGDANNSFDLELVPSSNVTGRILFHLPYLGYLSQSIRTRQGWLLIVIIPATIFILIELVKILKLIWSDDKEVEESKPAARQPRRFGVSEYGKKKRRRVP
jgi:signal peptidase